MSNRKKGKRKRVKVGIWRWLDSCQRPQQPGPSQQPGPLAAYRRIMKDPAAKAEREAALAAKAEETRPARERAALAAAAREAARTAKRQRLALAAAARKAASQQAAIAAVARKAEKKAGRKKKTAPKKTTPQLPSRVTPIPPAATENHSPVRSSGNLGEIPIGYLPWKVLPPGESLFERLRSLLALYRPQHQGNHDFNLDRLKALMGHNPSQCYQGVDEFDGYIVFLFTHTRKVALECLKIGNAIYVIEGDWRALCQLSKSDLLNQHAEHVTRIVHRGSWRTRLRKALQ